MEFVWFWTFWHWSKESFRNGFLLRDPLHGIGSHWDEWFHHVASENDRHAIESIRLNETSQREFIAWLLRHWADEEKFRGNGVARHFVLGQLAVFAPFNGWTAFDKYRGNYGIGGIPAIVLAEKSSGEVEDVRRSEAIILPQELTEPAIIADGFQADAVELDNLRRAAIDVLRGKGLLLLLVLWAVFGKRPYPRWLRVELGLCWAMAAGMILFLLFGPEPSGQLVFISGALVGLWMALVLVAASVIGIQSWYAWRAGRKLSAALEQGQMRLRLDGGLTLKGGSAGLPICLNAIFALSFALPGAAATSWLWRQFFSRMHSEAGSWAATGIVSGNGCVKPVVLEPKLRACLKHAKIREMLTPRQRDADQRVVDRVADSLASAHVKGAPVSGLPNMRLGFAAEKPCLRTHPCRHISQAVMTFGGLTDRWQQAANFFGLVVTVVMIFALPDLRAILSPYQPPAAVPPASASPYELWVSLDTEHPKYFSVVLESAYWSNRRAEVMRHEGINPSTRAEIRFHRLTGMAGADENDGDVWIERRQRFLSREFNPGERVGHYSLPYLSRLGHE